jgi:hypothetical protein
VTSRAYFVDTSYLLVLFKVTGVEVPRPSGPRRARREVARR